MKSTIILSTLSFVLAVTLTSGQLLSGTILTGLGGLGSSALYYWKNEWCHGPDWDNNQIVNLASDYVSGGKWINYNPDFTDLTKKVFGQHIATRTALGLVRQHLKNDNPSKALVLSFHGSTGIGKTFLAKHLAKAIYKQYHDTEKSNFVHVVFSTHFKASETAILNRLKETLEKGFSSCERTFFIIEEVDKYPTAFLDALIPYLEHSVTIDGKTYNTRKAIFILLS